MLSLSAGVNSLLPVIHTRIIQRHADRLRIKQLTQERKEKLAAIRQSGAEVMAKVEQADRVLADANRKLQAVSKRALTELGQYSKPPVYNEIQDNETSRCGDHGGQWRHWFGHWQIATKCGMSGSLTI